MTKNPYFSALGAILYIVGIVLVINVVTSFSGPNETILIPMVMLGLFVLSAAVMGFLFFYEPFQLYFTDRKQEALQFFGKTVASFACFVTALLAVFLFLSFQ